MRYFVMATQGAGECRVTMKADCCRTSQHGHMYLRNRKGEDKLSSAADWPCKRAAARRKAKPHQRFGACSVLLCKGLRSFAFIATKRRQSYYACCISLPHSSEKPVLGQCTSNSEVDNTWWTSMDDGNLHSAMLVDPQSP